MIKYFELFRCIRNNQSFDKTDLTHIQIELFGLIQEKAIILDLIGNRKQNAENMRRKSNANSCVGFNFIQRWENILLIKDTLEFMPVLSKKLSRPYKGLSIYAAVNSYIKYGKYNIFIRKEDFRLSRYDISKAIKYLKDNRHYSKNIDYDLASIEIINGFPDSAFSKEELAFFTDMISFFLKQQVVFHLKSRIDRHKKNRDIISTFDDIYDQLFVSGTLSEWTSNDCYFINSFTRYLPSDSKYTAIRNLIYEVDYLSSKDISIIISGVASKIGVSLSVEETLQIYKKILEMSKKGSGD